MVFWPTRGKRIVDPCFTNNIAIMHNIKVTPIILAEHNLIELAMYIPRKATDIQASTKRTESLFNMNFHNGG